MELVDYAARWDPVPQEPACQVWLPAQDVTAPAGRPSATAAPRVPRSLVVRVTAQQARDLPLWLPRLLAEQDVGPGDRVTVDLADLERVHLTGLRLLLTVLWRRVAMHGDVLLTGGTPGLRAQLRSLGLTPATCRAAVHGPVHAPAAAAPISRQIPGGMDPLPLAQLVPPQPRPQDQPGLSAIGDPDAPAPGKVGSAVAPSQVTREVKAFNACGRA